MHQYRGHFEIHITAKTAGIDDLERFRAWCRNRNWKCVNIILDRGSHAQQPMATWRRRATTLAAVVDEAQRAAIELQRSNLAVARIKVEAAPHNDDVPHLDTEAESHDPTNYFEHHVKLLRAVTRTAGRLLEVCESHGAHLSRNAFRQGADGKQERFVTLRNYHVGRTTSDECLRRLLADLRNLNENILEHESEYCVFDSNLELDAGWLPDLQ